MSSDRASQKNGAAQASQAPHRPPPRAASPASEPAAGAKSPAPSDLVQGPVLPSCGGGAPGTDSAAQAEQRQPPLRTRSGNQADGGSAQNRARKTLTRVSSLRERLEALAARSLLRAVRQLPYPKRVAAMGWLMRRVLGPLAGGDRRIAANLTLVWPDLPRAKRAAIVRGVLDNFGRAVAELFSGPEFARLAATSTVLGEGLALLDAQHRAGRPVILATAHLGNYDAARAFLIARGFRVGGFYRPMKNPGFNIHYVAAIESIGTPLFPAGREGMAAMVRFLRAGGMLGLVVDHHIATGLPMPFLGVPAKTPLSAAELSLRYDAPLVPIYGIRQDDGLSFCIQIEPPIPPSDPRQMTEALNASIEAMVRRFPEQWFWLHRRWKGFENHRKP